MKEEVFKGKLGEKYISSQRVKTTEDEDKMYEGCAESHEQLFLHANWEQQTKESAVVDGTSCCVILECLMTSIACIT